MPCTPIAFRRQGFGFLDYTLQGGLNAHRMRFGLVYPVLPTDVGTVEPALYSIAELVRSVLPNNATIVGGGTLDQTGSIVALFTGGYPLVGAHADGSGAEDYYARTITITGKGFPVSGGACTGQTRVVLFVGKAFNFLPGQRQVVNGFDAALDAVAAALADPTSILWADFYGQKAGVRGKYPTQFNAFVQRKKGQ